MLACIWHDYIYARTFISEQWSTEHNGSLRWREIWRWKVNRNVRAWLVLTSWHWPLPWSEVASGKADERGGVSLVSCYTVTFYLFNLNFVIIIHVWVMEGRSYCQCLPYAPFRKKIQTPPNAVICFDFVKVCEGVFLLCFLGQIVTWQYNPNLLD